MMAHHCKLCAGELEKSPRPYIGAWYCPKCRAYWINSREEAEQRARILNRHNSE